VPKTPETPAQKERRLKRNAKKRISSKAWRVRNYECFNAYRRGVWRAMSSKDKAARRDALRAWKKANPEKVKASAAKYRLKHKDSISARGKKYRSPEKDQARRLSTYGITQEEYDFIWARQNESCGVCGALKPGSKGWAIDHDHNDNHVRGILCSRCNLAIGALGDSLEGLFRAVKYLELDQLRIGKLATLLVPITISSVIL
jgi:hypothetical protein